MRACVCECAFVISRYRVSVGRCFILYISPLKYRKIKQHATYAMGRYINHQCKPFHTHKKSSMASVCVKCLYLPLSIAMIITVIIIIIEAYPVRIILEVMLKTPTIAMTTKSEE